MNKRYLELDSLRGLAALFVLFYHCLRIFPTFDVHNNHSQTNNFVSEIMINTPLRILWSGHESVILFFVLSGFVLSLPYYKNRNTDYKTFLTKRTVRIYIPYLVSITIAMIAVFLFSQKGLPAYSVWFNKIWNSETTFLGILNHFLFLGYYNADEYNTVIWSLVHEMRISIIFPFLMMIILKFNWKVNLSIGLTLSLVSFILLKKINPIYNTNLILTLHYTSMFIIGALMAKHIDYLVNLYKNTAKPIKVLFCTVAIILYTYGGLFTNINFAHNFLIDEYAIVIGSVIFIVVALSSGIFSKFLNLRPMLFLGKISYSLYLCHAIVLFSLIYVLNDELPIFLILSIAIISSIVISIGFYYLIERPSMNIGKKIGKEKLNKVA